MICFLLCLTSASGRTVELDHYQFVKTFRISAIPYNDQTRAVVRKFFDNTIARNKTPTIEDMRELRAGLVAVIGEEAVTAAGMTPIPEDANKPAES